MKDMNKMFEEVNDSVSKLHTTNPEMMKSFNDFMCSVEKPNALDTKTKELISVALSVSARCEWCIALHVKKALNAGASRAEIIESSFVAVLMSGGPGLMYTQYVLKALDDFEK